jgi:ATP-binding cassette, subfamily C (CFTR/MRP), member 1
VVEVTRSSFRTQASLAASLLVLAASIALCFLSYSEHTRNIRPSSLINAYLLLTLPFDASQLRTRWLRGENLAGNAVASATLVIKITIIISEAAEKRRLLLTPFADPSPEATSGLYSRGLFWWLNSLFRIGFSKLVSDNDLFKTDTKLLSKSLEASFNKHWVEREPSLYHQAIGKH